MKRLLSVFAFALLVAFAAGAQEANDIKCLDQECCDECFNNTFYPGWYFGALGGIIYTSSSEWAYGGWSKFQHINFPNFSFNLGYDFTPVFGLRASLSGPMGNYPGPDHKTINRFGYGQAVLDATFDILNIFRQKEMRRVNPYIFLGGGAYYRFAVAGKEADLGPAARLGGGLRLYLNEKINIVFELQNNALDNKFNSLTDLDKADDLNSGYHGDDGLYYGGEILKITKPFRWDDNVAALVGVKYNFGSVKKRAAAKAACMDALAAARAAADAEAARLAAEEAARLEAERLAAEKAEAERLAAAKAAEEAAAAARAAARAAEENILFDLGKSVIRESEMPKVEHLISIMKEYPEAVITISGYADRETGNAKKNMELSERRAAVLTKALTDAGIAAERISSAYFGDTVRVAPTPEENRVSVCVTK